MLVELTVPFEANWETAHQRKMAKYQTLLSNARDQGWVPELCCIEMGSRGLPSTGWNTWASKMCVPAKISKECAEIALRASHLIWVLRDTTWPDPPLLSPEQPPGPVRLAVPHLPSKHPRFQHSPVPTSTTPGTLQSSSLAAGADHRPQQGQDSAPYLHQLSAELARVGMSPPVLPNTVQSKLPPAIAEMPHRLPAPCLPPDTPTTSACSL